MDFILFPFFLLRLIIIQIPFVAAITKVALTPVRSLLVMAILISMYGYFLIANLSKKATTSTLELSPPPPDLGLNYQGLKTISVSSKPEVLLPLKEKIEAQLIQHPTHRDLLLNLAIIDQALDNPNFKSNLDLAKKIDPNHQIWN